MKTLVVGGRTPNGTTISEGIREFDFHVETDEIIDFANPDSFESALPFPIIVNTNNAAPKAFVEFCLRENIILIETKPNTSTLKELLSIDVEKASGTVILGAGLHTGLTNLLAAFVSENKQHAVSLTPESEGTIENITVSLPSETQSHFHFHRPLGFFERMFASLRALFNSDPSTDIRFEIQSSDKTISLEITNPRVDGLTIGAMILELMEGREFPVGVHLINNIFFLESNLSLIDAISENSFIFNRGET